MPVFGVIDFYFLYFVYAEQKERKTDVEVRFIELIFKKGSRETISQRYGESNRKDEREQEKSRPEKAGSHLSPTQ
jgi:hypothetical protein